MNLDFIYNRHSVRKFEEIQVPLDDVKMIIDAATHAPSGKNIQNWHFVVIRDQALIQQIADCVSKRHIEIAEMAKDPEVQDSFMKFLKYHTSFKNAPTLILVYAGPYPMVEVDILKENNASEEIIADLMLPSPRLQNVGAAMENLLLAATAMGYGTCWMTGFNYSRHDIEALVPFHKEGYDLVALTPLGKAFGDVISTPRRPLDEVMTVVE